MMPFLKSSDINKEKWDRLISEALNGMPYGYSWYLDTVTDTWGGLVKGDYEAVMPLVYRKKLGVEYCYQPFFTQFFAVYGKKSIQVEMETEFLKSIPAGLKLLEFNFKSESSEFSQKNFSTRERKTYHLHLDKEYDDISSGYSTNLKRNLKKARQELLQIVKNVQPEMLINMFTSTIGKNLKELSNKDYYALEKLMKLSVSKGMGEVMGAYNQQNELLAGGFFIHSHNKIINLFPASNNAGKKVGAMPFLIDYVIQAHAGSGKVLDFEGSEIPSVAKFYSSFGAEPVAYLQISRNNLPWGLKKAFGIYKKLK